MQHGTAKYGIHVRADMITNFDTIRCQRIVQKLIVRVVKAMNERVRGRFALLHQYVLVPYLRDDKGVVDFILDEGDRWALDEGEAEKLLTISTELDDEYDNINGKEYSPGTLT